MFCFESALLESLNQKQVQYQQVKQVILKVVNNFQLSSLQPPIPIKNIPMVRFIKNPKKAISNNLVSNSPFTKGCIKAKITKATAISKKAFPVSLEIDFQSKKISTIKMKLKN